MAIGYFFLHFRSLFRPTIRYLLWHHTYTIVAKGESSNWGIASIATKTIESSVLAAIATAAIIDPQTCQNQIADCISDGELAKKAFLKIKCLHFRHDRDD
jgi:hypothetical protein